MNDRRFPILLPSFSVDNARMKALGCPRSIPRATIAQHEAQARRNHGQSLEELARRGGLSAGEAVAVLEDRDWHQMSDEDAVRRLLELCA